LSGADNKGGVENLEILEKSYIVELLN